jgi:hypothetical protein
MATKTLSKDKKNLYTILQYVLGAMMLATGGFGAKLFAGAAVIGFNPDAHTGTDVGSRVFFMALSGITLGAFAIGFAMMIAQVRMHLTDQRR